MTTKILVVSGEEAGVLIAYGPLTFLNVGFLIPSVT